MNLRNKTLLNTLLAFVSAAGILLLFLAVNNYVPFGDARTMASNDINYSLFDQFGYLKDCLEGKNSFGYSFSMGLGGDTANVLAYALTSPLNLLVLFFDKSQFHIFFAVQTVIKIGLIAATMSYYLQKRFNHKIRSIFVLLLALSYAFSQYSIYQICNIFWLDGVIMLPLILLGVYKIIREDNPLLFAASIGIAVLCNWYSGAECCIFSIFWYLFELALYQAETKKLTFKTFWKKSLLAVAGGLTGVMISFVILYPAAQAIKMGNRGSFNLNEFNFGFIGNPLSAVANDLIGSYSAIDQVSLYCGSFALLGMIAYFLKKSGKKSFKVINLIFAVFILMAFYWRPLYLLFSLLKNVSSFFSRYSFVGIFAIVFIAAEYYENWKADQKFDGLMIAAALVIGVVMIILNHFRAINNFNGALKTMIAMTVTASGLWLLSKTGKKVSAILVMGLVMGELYYNTSEIMAGMHMESAVDYENHVSAEEKQIDAIKEMDSSAYRLTNNLTRNQGMWWPTANYNEGFNYGYWSLSSYTNSPDDRQRNMLDHFGYRTNGENYYIVNTSVLAADSLLGVKYFISYYPIEGYEKLEEFDTVNNKDVYQNPYTLPMAYMIEADATAEITYDNNPFEYQNQVYQNLTGSSESVYRKLEYTSETDGLNVTYTITVPEGEYAVYGNIPWDADHEMNANILKEDGSMLTIYSQWGSPSVFYIPHSEGSNTVKITLSASTELSILDEQFYALDISAMEKMYDQLSANPVDSLNVQNGHVSVTATAEYDGQQLMTSIPYDAGWNVTVDGEVVEPELFDNCLMVLPLSKGEHQIEMKYTVPGFRTGLIATCAGILIVAGYAIYRRKKYKEA